jgi:hypothetical protein
LQIAWKPLDVSACTPRIIDQHAPFSEEDRGALSATTIAAKVGG